MGKTAILAVKIISDAKDAVGGMNKANLAIGALVVGAVKLGKDFVNSFTTAGGSVLKWQRIVGGSAESASRLSFAVKQSGVDSDKAVGSFGKFEKTLALAAKTTKGTKAMTDLLGQGFTDARGKLLPMDQILPGLMDKFSKMPAGPERTALAMQLFGKSGTDMLPFLTKGSAGLAELAKKSDAYGHTLTGSNLQAIKDSKAAQRDWTASVEGFKIQFGAQLLPMITTGATTISSQLIPVIIQGTQWLMNNHDAVALVIGVFGGLIGIIKVVTMLSKAWAAVQVVLNIAMSANPIGLVVLAIAALVAGFIYLWNTNKDFRDFFINSWAQITATAAGVSAWFTGVFVPALGIVWANITTPIVTFWAKFAAGWNAAVTFTTGIPGRITAAVGGLGSLLVTKGQNLITGLRDGATGTWHTVTTWVGGMGSRITSAVGNAGTWLVGAGGNVVEGLWKGISDGYSWIKGKITSWVGNVMDWFKKVFGINSPSTRMEKQIGRFLPAGVGVGVTRNQSALLNPLRALSVAAVKAFSPVLTVPALSVPTPALSAASAASGATGARSVTIHIHGAVDTRGTAKQIRDVLSADGRQRGVITLDGVVIV